MALLVLALCLGLPAVEIWVMILVAGQIGVAPMLLSVLALSLIGVWLLRYESTRAWRAFQLAVRDGGRPERIASNGALSVLGSILLIIPGFVTAALGLLCLLPPTRALLRGVAVTLLMGPALRRAGVSRSAAAAGMAVAQPIRVRATRGHPVIDGEVEK